MRIFNRAHVPWFLFCILATAVACWIYLGNFRPAALPTGLGLPHSLTQTASTHHAGGTPVGLVFGSIAFVIFIFAALFGLRKKLLRWRIGSVQSWMRAHIWLTLLTIPLVILHSGFRAGGPMTILLLWLYAIVMVSGIYGLILQHRIPRLMQERLPVETIFEQIPHVRTKLRLAAEELRTAFDAPGTTKVLAAATATASIGTDVRPGNGDAETYLVPPASELTLGNEEIAAAPDRESEMALREFLDTQVLSYLRGRRRHTGLTKSQLSDDTFRFVRLHVTQPYRGLVDQMQAWCDECRLLDLQTKLHHWLHAWLFIHIPLSFLLVLLTAWHAVVTLFYY